MEIIQGKEYLFEYLSVKIQISDDKILEKKPRFSAFVPVDYNNWDIDGVYLLKIYGESANDEFYYVRYYDKIKTSGKYKWNLIEEKTCETKVKDCPHMIDCSLNTNEHPKDRNWFLFDNCGFSEKDNEDVGWECWNKYNRMEEHVDFTLYYQLLVELTKGEYEKIGRNCNSFEEWVKEIDKQYTLNNFYKMSQSSLHLRHENYLRDILKLW